MEILILVLIGNSVYAQVKVGIELGTTINNVTTDASMLSYTSVRPEFSYSIGSTIQYPIMKHMSLVLPVALLQKNYSFQRTGPYKGIFQKKNNTYLQVPFLFHYEIGKKISFFIEPGVFTSYWIKSAVHGTIPDIFTANAQYNNNQSYYEFQLIDYKQNIRFDFKDNRFEFGWVAGGGLTYKIGSNRQFIFASRYYESLTKEKKDYMLNQAPKYNRTLAITFGALINIRDK